MVMLKIIQIINILYNLDVFHIYIYHFKLIYDHNLIILHND